MNMCASFWAGPREDFHGKDTSWMSKGAKSAHVPFVRWERPCHAHEGALRDTTVLMTRNQRGNDRRDKIDRFPFSNSTHSWGSTLAEGSTAAFFFFLLPEKQRVLVSRASRPDVSTYMDINQQLDPFSKLVEGDSALFEKSNDTSLPWSEDLPLRPACEESWRILFHFRNREK